MGRRKSYETDEVAERAMHLFWERGYHATSTRDLTEAMGVNPYSLYAEFGSKEGLYEHVLEHYDRTVVTGHFGNLESESASLEDIGDLLEYFGGGPEVAESTLGCLLCNAAVEVAPSTEVSRATTARYTDRLTAAFENALENARADGLLNGDAPITDLARFLTMVMMGLFTLMRAGADPVLLRAGAMQAFERIQAIRLDSQDAKDRKVSARRSTDANESRGDGSV